MPQLLGFKNGQAEIHFPDAVIHKASLEGGEIRVTQKPNPHTRFFDLEAVNKMMETAGPETASFWREVSKTAEFSLAATEATRSDTGPQSIKPALSFNNQFTV